MAPRGLGGVAGVAQACRCQKSPLDHLLGRQVVWVRGRAG